MATAETPVETPHLSFARRIAGALRLAPEAFEDVESDPRALGQAAGVVVLAGLARGIGAFGREGAAGLIGSPAVAIVV